MPQNFKQALSSIVEIDREMLSDSSYLQLKKYSCYALEFITTVQMLINKNSYFVVWNQDAFERVKSDMDITDDVLNGLIEKSLQTGWFDSDVFTDYKVLTSRSIQHKWYIKCRRRSLIQIDKRLDLTKSGFKENLPQFEKVQFVDFTNPKSEPITIKADPVAVAARTPVGFTESDFTGEEMKKFINVDYEDRLPAFKERYKNGTYSSYVSFCELIINKIPGILKSDRQITIRDFVDIFIKYNPDPKSTKDVLIKIDGTGVKPDTGMKSRFISYYETHIANTKKTSTPARKSTADVQIDNTGR